LAVVGDEPRGSRPLAAAAGDGAVVALPPPSDAAEVEAPTEAGARGVDFVRSRTAGGGEEAGPFEDERMGSPLPAGRLDDEPPDESSDEPDSVPAISSSEEVSVAAAWRRARDALPVVVVVVVRRVGGEPDRPAAGLDDRAARAIGEMGILEGDRAAAAAAAAGPEPIRLLVDEPAMAPDTAPPEGGGGCCCCCCCCEESRRAR